MFTVISCLAPCHRKCALLQRSTLVGTPSEVVDLWHNEFPDDVVGCLEPACGVKEGGVRRLVCFGQPRNRRYAALFEEFQRNPLLKLDDRSSICLFYCTAQITT
jgi:hypothetical protein